MSNKRKLTSILGVAGATVLAAGGSAFLTNTGLSLIGSGTATVREAGEALGEKETELPISVETFAKTRDSFTINLNGENESGETPETNEDGTPAANLPSGGSTMYASGNVNVRSGADTDSEVLGTLNVGDDVTVVGTTEDGWTEVSYNGQTAYISSNYLSSNQTSATSGSSTSGSSTSGSSTSGSSSAGNSSAGSSTGNSGSQGTVVSGTTMYTTAGLNVRSNPSREGRILGTLNPGEAITVVDNRGDGWSEVYYNGQTAYVGSNYLSSSQNSGSSGSSSSGSSSSGSSSSGSSGAWDDSYMLYDINSRYISADELSGWSSSNLATLRNEIFARHGRIFTKQSWIDYFSQKTWYTPTYDPSYFDNNMSSFLNDYEWANLNVILQLEG